MKLWKVTGSDYNVKLGPCKYAPLPTLYVMADSFDEAIALARQIHPCYNGGQVCTEQEANEYRGSVVVSKSFVMEGGASV